MGAQVSRGKPYRLHIINEKGDCLKEVGLAKRFVISLPEGKEHEVNFDSVRNANRWFWRAKRIRGTKFDKTTSDFVCSGVIDMEEWMERACGISFAEDASCGTTIENRTCDFFFSSTEAKDKFAYTYLVFPRLVGITTISVDGQLSVDGE